MGNTAPESISETEAVQKVIEINLITTAEFREAEMRMKLKECQGVRIRQYHLQGQYIEGEKVWYQHRDSNTWLGPSEVIYNKGNKVWLYTNGDVQKAAISKVKTYELIPR